MKTLTTSFALLAIVFVFAGCKAGIPNAVFNCAEDIDCPPSFFCHQSQNLCFDTPETCVKTRSCGGVYECGTIDDGCGNELVCDPCAEPEVCGGGGSPFVCDCEIRTCDYYGSRPCGFASSGCDTTLIDCTGGGENSGCEVGWECVENQCECPPGDSCNDCDPACTGNFICVDSACVCDSQTCEMQGYECTPNTGPGPEDGCGNPLDCDTQCDDGETCGTWDSHPFTCGGCTCKDQGYECGKPMICGEQVAAECGICDSGERCGDDFKCKCEDAYDEAKRNDQIESASDLGTVEKDSFLKRVDATLDADSDVDWYRVQKSQVDGSTISASIIESELSQELTVLYRCPSNSDTHVECLVGKWILMNGFKGCKASGDNATVALRQNCEKEGEATVFVRVSVEEWKGECSPYAMRVQSGSLIEPPL